ncbi:hypothetical protein FTRO_0230020 [Fructobacillus tropaeoli]|uniref:Uncharacterized protein n=1 Tax=Fructobacillus tropaeoli TaxID=709323 RepID=A0A3F3H3I6_9LACO|nr:hypothetical protein FTRO_0230020 [Fructobacillus tropaeoli]
MTYLLSIFVLSQCDTLSIIIIGFATILNNGAGLAQKIISLAGITLCAIRTFVFINKHRNNKQNKK